MRPLFTLLLALLALAPGCIAVELPEGDAELTIVNSTSYNQIEVGVETVADWGYGAATTSPLASGEYETIFLLPDLYDVYLIDHAGDGCIVRSVAFLTEMSETVTIYDHDLLACATEPLDRLEEDPFGDLPPL